MTEKKYRVGILIFGDPTRGGTIASEVKFLANLYDFNKDDTEFVIMTVNPSVTKRVIKEKTTSYNFPHKLVTVFSEKDFDVLSTLSALVTYPGHSNFFGGYLNDNVVKMYKIISHCTNNLKIPAFIRINDSEIKVRDYRMMSEIRLKGKPESSFMADPLNVEKARSLVSFKHWDYNLVYWFANGSKEACDWVPETMYDREDDQHRCSTRENFEKNAIYVSDDIFFLVRKNYARFAEYKLDDAREEKICYIGFFDTVNGRRAKAFDTIYKTNSYKVPMKIFGIGTAILTKLKDKPNVEIEEGFIKGDSQEYFDFLHKHMAYIFVGKGHSEARYIGKTVYDAVVARTPVIVYRPCDEKMIAFSNPEYYFTTEKELDIIYQKLKDPQVRKQWIEDQTKEIFSKLPIPEFKFSAYCNSPAEDLKDERVHTPGITELPARVKKQTTVAVSEEPKKTSQPLF